MNERIQKLIYKLNDQVGLQWTNEDKLKFAELIVKECIDQAHGVANLRGTNDDMIYGADTAAVRIAKHFGVKE